MVTNEGQNNHTVRCPLCGLDDIHMVRFHKMLNEFSDDNIKAQLTSRRKGN